LSGAARRRNIFRRSLLWCALAAATITTAFAEPLAIEVAYAEQAYDQRTGEPVVSFRMTASSARAFAELTRDNVGRTAAILIDGRVMTKPVIREPILGGSGQISGHFSFEQAREIALRLSSGAAKMEIEIVPDQSSGK
jgi:preprotein translocase subunit SecD